MTPSKSIEDQIKQCQPCVWMRVVLMVSSVIGVLLTLAIPILLNAFAQVSTQAEKATLAAERANAKAHSNETSIAEIRRDVMYTRQGVDEIKQSLIDLRVVLRSKQP